ncbi:uncharacterized protein LOC111396482 [Olea europaea var. sylvestris]|uniref:uncharacterized protein LOC111396482 n=1 Tax=Olea europaea var. sylvestris TaxID=158386 RepID=UPI000C1CE9E0|nr:uncharacterized protein LOC111396482 [Olea europaea var. sylvestris]
MKLYTIVQVVSFSSTGCTQQLRKNNLVETSQQGDCLEEHHAVTQQLVASNSIAPSSANVAFQYPVGTTIPFQSLIPPSQSAVMGWMYSVTQSSVGPLFTPTSEHQ